MARSDTPVSARREMRKSNRRARLWGQSDGSFLHTLRSSTPSARRSRPRTCLPAFVQLDLSRRASGCRLGEKFAANYARTLRDPVVVADCSEARCTMCKATTPPGGGQGAQTQACSGSLAHRRFHGCPSLVAAEWLGCGWRPSATSLVAPARGRGDGARRGCVASVRGPFAAGLTDWQRARGVGESAGVCGGGPSAA
jgi:hypothetical protein